MACVFVACRVRMYSSELVYSLIFTGDSNLGDGELHWWITRQVSMYPVTKQL